MTSLIWPFGPKGGSLPTNTVNSVIGYKPAKRLAELRTYINTFHLKWLILDHCSKSMLRMLSPDSVCFVSIGESLDLLSLILAVLVLYLTFYLHFDEDTSTSLYHSFIVLCYATPLLGAIIADSCLGKFK